MATEGEKLSEDDIQELSKAFKLCDEANSGRIKSNMLKVGFPRDSGLVGFSKRIFPSLARSRCDTLATSYERMR